MTEYGNCGTVWLQYYDTVQKPCLSHITWIHPHEVLQERYVSLLPTVREQIILCCLLLTKQEYHSSQNTLLYHGTVTKRKP